MQMLKGIFDFYINSSIHVALAVYALTWISLIQFGLEYDENVLYTVFFGSITGYNFVKYFGLAKLFHRRLTNRLKIIQIFSLICFMILCYYLLRLETLTLLYIGVFAVMTFLYAIPVMPKKIFLDEQQNLRSIGGLKIYIIALVWTGVTVVLPLTNNGYPITSEVIITILQRFLMILVLMLPFEIRDMNDDSLKLATIPQRIGITRTKIIGVVLLLFFFVLEFMRESYQSADLILLGTITMLMLVALIYATKHQSKYYSSFFVEAIPVFWLVLMLLF